MRLFEANTRPHILSPLRGGCKRRSDVRKSKQAKCDATGVTTGSWNGWSFATGHEVLSCGFDEWSNNFVLRGSSRGRLASFEVAHFESREATVANSLGRQPKETDKHGRSEPRSGGRSGVLKSAAASRLKPIPLVTTLGLTPKAIRCRCFAAQNAQLQNGRVGLVPRQRLIGGGLVVRESQSWND